MDVAVLGAGPAGLAAAWGLAEAGRSVVVLERAPVPGGMAASFAVAGQSVDHGSHRLHHATPPAVLAELAARVPGDLQWRRRAGRIRLEGRWVGFPLQAPDLLRSLPLSFAVAAARDAVLAPVRRPTRDTFGEVVRAGLGPTMLDRFYGPYARKLWGLDPDQLDGEAARRRIAAATPGAMLGKVLRLGSGQATKAGFWYPSEGFGAIPTALAEAARTAGAELRYRADVGTLEGSGEGWRVTTADGEDVEARRVLSSLPVGVLAHLARPAPPAMVLDAGRKLSFRALVLVYLVLEVPRWTPYDAHYLPALDTPLTRISEPKNYRDGPDPPGRTVLCAEIPCAVGDDLWRADDDELGAVVRKAVSGNELPSARPVEVVVRRVPRAYPVYDLDYRETLATLDSWVDGLAGVVTLGRAGLHTHDNLHHAMAMGAAAAAAVGPGGDWDAASWEAARRRIAAIPVED